jgi:di/tricarboxylate transporter
MWTIVFLAMGGIALGKGVMSSGLLEVMDVLIRDLVDGLSLYTVVLVMSPVVLVRFHGLFPSANDTHNPISDHLNIH